MPDEMPSQNTQWVACATANDALVKLCSNLVYALAKRGDGAKAEVDRILGAIVTDYDFGLNFTDLEPGEFDVDEAQRIALEMIGDDLQLIRRNAL